MSKQAIALLFLKELERVERTDLKPYCIELVTRDKSYYISMKNDEELYSWMDEIYLVCCSCCAFPHLPNTFYLSSLSALLSEYLLLQTFLIMYMLVSILIVVFLQVFQKNGKHCFKLQKSLKKK